MNHGKNFRVFAPGKPVSFTLDEDQVRRANNFATRHKCTRRGDYGTAGDKFTFRFCPSGIGDFVSIHCSCGKSADLTGDL